MIQTVFNRYKTVLVLTTALILSACTTKTQLSGTPEENWQSRQVELQAITSFQVNGSLAYLSDKTKQYARFFVSQTSVSDYEIKLTTPLGSTVMTLVSKPNMAWAIDKDGNQFSGANMEQILYQLTEMNIPLTSLHQWLIGLSNNPEQDQLDSSGRLRQTQFSQDGVNWQLKIDRYMSSNKNLSLPAQLELMHRDEIIRLKMNSWTL
ncbi:lipoprotein insertase outer membrane protein LolB [Zophobihabitans entericus]|uniref:Outer-membrane lipoprotein LolB n=1 Tax=Zophobihabitans entericus TaxID=1635327 RepID=A0A6G9ICZ6_9GAMM|nr:lipoprotein insertase outer membrane protein LolB [Zophobihabitans entericus]QIQ22108.1 outer membrane lipoprotein LolB [Zophobihabitans entericus]